MMSQREDIWRKRTEKEIEKRRKMEEYFKHALKEAQESKKTVLVGGPDCEVIITVYYMAATAVYLFISNSYV